MYNTRVCTICCDLALALALALPLALVPTKAVAGGKRERERKRKHAVRAPSLIHISHPKLCPFPAHFPSIMNTPMPLFHWRIGCVFYLETEQCAENANRCHRGIRTSESSAMPPVRPLDTGCNRITKFFAGHACHFEISLAAPNAEQTVS